MPNIYSIVAGAAVATYALLQWLLKYTQDAREPPALATSLPFISPIIGMFRKKTKYYIQLYGQTNLPIYTLRLPFSRMYIINSPALISAAQRQYRTLSFWPLMADASAKIMQLSKTGSEILHTNTNGDEGPDGYVITFHDATQPPLAPGPDLDAMNRVMLGLVAMALNRVRDVGVKRVKLNEWVTEQITMATTNAAYGPANPYKDPAFVALQWTFQSGMSNMILGLPASTARQAFASGAATFEKYFANGHHHQASALIEARYKHSTDHHLPLNDIGQSEFSNGVALLSNTIPNSFWMLYHVYSDPTVLADCRSELSRIVALGKNNTATLDISKVKTACPVLLSTYKEVLRLYSAAVSARLVMKDHMLDNQFLLKAGSTVLMPAPVQHHSAAVWGSDNSTFNHRRFADAKSTNQAGFRAFGGGTTLCPGRHFATTEILAFTAIMVLQYDVVPVGGSWGAKMESDAEFWESSSRPVGDVEVEIRERAGEWKGKQWAFTLSDLEEPIALSAEDMPDFAH